MVVFQQPQQGDLTRNLSIVLHAAHRKARQERGKLVAQCASKGTLDSSMFISAIVESVEAIHARAVEQAMNVVNEFAGPLNVPVDQVTTWARPHLENISNTLVGMMMPQGGGGGNVMASHFAAARTQYQAVFQQRVDTALRDFEVGFIGGKSVWQTATEKKTAELLQVKPTLWGMGIDLKEFARRVPSWWRRLTRR
jgi:hypothetical protein